MPRCAPSRKPDIMCLKDFLHNCFERRTFADFATKDGNFLNGQQLNFVRSRLLDGFLRPVFWLARKGVTADLWLARSLQSPQPK